MDELITNEIHRTLKPPGIMPKESAAPLFDWLNYMDRNEGEKCLKKYSICLEAKHIPDPSADLKTYNYRNVEYDYFSKPRERLERRNSDQRMSQLAEILTLCDSKFWTGVENETI